MAHQIVKEGIAVTKTSTVSEAVNELTKQITSLYRQREQAIVRELTALAAMATSPRRPSS